jgi:hypothetical protein
MSTALLGGSPLAGNPAVAEFLATLDYAPAVVRLTESNYVNLALDFASVQLPRAAGLAHRCYTQLMTGVRLEDPLPDLPAPDGTVAALQEAQNRFVSWLEIIRKDEPRPIAKVAAALHSAGSRILMRPAFVAGANAVEVSYRCYPADFDAALGFVLMLLLDPARPFRGNLCRCKFTDCQRYFLAIKPATGRPRRDYCSSEHLAQARNADSAARIRGYRQRLREQAKRPTRRKPK